MLCPICYEKYQDKFFTIINGKNICRHCKDFYYYKHNDNTFSLEFSRAFDYDFEPANFIFNRTPYERTDLYCGIELEVNTKANEKRQLLNNFFTDDFFYFKNDGSINVYGVEIVSHPATLKYHLQNKWIEIFRFFQENKIDNVRNCGLHFHFDRNAFTSNQIAILDYLINSDKTFIETIGGRKLNTYCKIANKTLSEYGRSTEGRYVALNLSNRKTIEMRFFKATTDFETFKNRLIYAFALCEVARHYNAFECDSQINKYKFMQFVKKLNKLIDK